MINLLPPSPAPSQIDTTFIRRERTDVSTERSEDDCYCSEEAEHVQKPEDARHIDDDEPEEDRSDEAAETTDFATLLSLVAQPKAHKKQVDSDVVVETPTQDASTDADSSQILMAATQWMLLQKTENAPTADTPAPADKAVAHVGDAQTFVATQLTKDSIKLTSTATDLPSSVKTSESTTTAVPLTDIAVSNVTNDAVEESKTTAVPKPDEPREVAPIKVETGLDQTLEVPIEIVAQTSKTSTVSTAAAASSSQLETAFETTQEPKFSTNGEVPERDEITREIERLISARPNQTLTRLASPEIRTPLDTLTLATVTGGNAEAEGATQIVDNVQRPNDAAVASTENDPIPTLARQTRSENQSSSQQSDDGGAQHHTPSTSSNAISATGWSGASTVSNDFAMTTRAEFQEPLSSQTARAIVQHFETRKTNENESLTVRLDPPELGELTIELSQTRDGLAVRVTAREAVTMEMLLSRGHEIEQHLKNQNVDVATMEFLSAGMMNQQSSRQNGSRNSSNDMMIESARRQSKSSLQSAADARSDAATVRDSSRPLSFRA